MVKGVYSILVNAAVFKDNKILVARRSNKEKHQAGKWCLPGGKLEEDDVVLWALEKTAKREVLEETGLSVLPIRLIYNNTFKHLEDNQSTLAIVFLCFWKAGRAQPLEDTQEVKWITKEEIDDFQFPPNVKKYIRAGFDEKNRTSKIL